jgi:hypothetical protein
MLFFCLCYVLVSRLVSFVKWFYTLQNVYEKIQVFSKSKYRAESDMWTDKKAYNVQGSEFGSIWGINRNSSVEPKLMKMEGKVKFGVRPLSSEVRRAGITSKLLEGQSRWTLRCSHLFIMLPL